MAGPIPAGCIFPPADVNWTQSPGDIRNFAIGEHVCVNDTTVPAYTGVYVGPVLQPESGDIYVHRVFQPAVSPYSRSTRWSKIGKLGAVEAAAAAAAWPAGAAPANAAAGPAAPPAAFGWPVLAAAWHAVAAPAPPAVAALPPGPLPVRDIPQRSVNVVTQDEEDLVEGRVMADFHGEYGYGRYYTRDTYIGLNPRLNPMTRRPILPADVTFYTAHIVPAAGGRRRKSRKSKNKQSRKVRKTRRVH